MKPVPPTCDSPAAGFYYPAAMALPNFIIAGVNKAGTTSLWTYLAGHPGVGPSAVKETCYWLPLRYPGEPLPPIETYHQQFLGHDDLPVRMESTPGYFFGGQPLAQAIDQACPGVKIAIVLREPVSRLLSFYKFKQSQLELPRDLSLKQYIDACRALSNDDLQRRDNNPYFGLAGGCYAQPLRAWQHVFGDRLRVLWFDDLKDNPKRVVASLCDWLDLDPAYADTLDTRIENQTTGYRFAGLQRLALSLNHAGETFWRKHPAVKRRLRAAYRALNGQTSTHQADDETLRGLRAYYAEQNAGLAELLPDPQHAPDWVKTPDAV